MAIQITDKLITDIQEQIADKAKQAIKAEFGSPNDDIPLFPCGEHKDFADRIYWGEHLHLKDKMPSDWLKGIQSACHGKWGWSHHPCRVENSQFKKVELQFSLDTQGQTYFAPPETNCYKLYFTLTEDSSESDPVVGPIVKMLRARSLASIRWSETAIKVTDFLKTCRSLNHAVKVWPELVNFLPEDRRNRLEEDNKPKAKKERTTPAPEEILRQINRDEIAADLVALRFATA
jgi:hypothetical protein